MDRFKKSGEKKDTHDTSIFLELEVEVQSYTTTANEGQYWIKRGKYSPKGTTLRAANNFCI